MADAAFQTQYREEFIAGYEARQSLLRNFVTTEVQLKGNQAIFLVADSGGAEATTRGLNGRIPGRADNLNQFTCTLAEYHDKPERTGFNIFASQGDGRKIMQMTSMGVLNRKTDDLIITELNTATQDTGAAAIASLRLVMKAKVILTNNKVPNDGNIVCLATPAFMAYLMELKEFASADYVTRKPFDEVTGWTDSGEGFYRWKGIVFIEHPSLPGVGTSAEKCFMFHRSSIGHAAPKELFMTAVGYNEEDDFSYSRVTSYQGAKLLQNGGVVVINHDGSAFVAS